MITMLHVNLRPYSLSLCTLPWGKGPLLKAKPNEYHGADPKTHSYKLSCAKCGFVSPEMDGDQYHVYEQSRQLPGMPAAAGGAQAASDLRAAEVSSPTVTSEAIAADTTLDRVAAQRKARREQKGSDGVALMKANNEITKASNAGENTVRTAKGILDAAGHDAQKIIRDGNAQVNTEETKMGNPLVRGLVEGIAGGAGTMGSTLGSQMGDLAASRVFGNKGRPGPAAPVSGSTSPSTPGHPPPPKPSSSGSSASVPGPVSPGTPGAHLCVACKKSTQTMEFPGVGWICHNCEKQGAGFPGPQQTGGQGPAPQSYRPTHPQTTTLDDTASPGAAIHKPLAVPPPPNVARPVADASAPGLSPRGPTCQMCRGGAGSPVTVVEGGSFVLCRACQDNNRCSRCGRVAQNLGGARFDNRDSSGRGSWGSIENACRSCVEQWQAQQRR